MDFEQLVLAILAGATGVSARANKSGLSDG